MSPLQTKSNQVQLTSTEDGIHLVGSILWLDAQHSGDLSFLSSATSIHGRLNSRILATEETLSILATHQQKPQSLIGQYNRPIALGPLKMELIPSGAGLGGASLYLETQQKRILYAPHIQPQKIAVARQMQLYPADTLILSAKIPYPQDKAPTRKKEKERLWQTVKAYLAAGQFPVILCEPYAIAQEITKLLTDHDIPVAVHNYIGKIHKIYESYGSILGSYTADANRYRNAKKVTLFPKLAKGRPRLRKPLPDGPIFMIEESPNAQSPGGIFRQVAERFYLPSYCDGRELKDVIQQVNPKEVFVFGPYAKEYWAHLKNAAPKVRQLYPSHLPTLF
jgi:hypothetical protein